MNGMSTCFDSRGDQIEIVDDQIYSFFDILTELFAHEISKIWFSGYLSGNQ